MKEKSEMCIHFIKGGGLPHWWEKDILMLKYKSIIPCHQLDKKKTSPAPSSLALLNFDFGFRFEFSND